MTTHQIAILLEIIGFLLASIFGGILLAPEVTGKFARWLESHFVRVAAKLQEIVIENIPTDKLVKLVNPTVLAPGLTYSFFWIASVACLILGWLHGLPILFWVGVALFCYYTLVSVVALVIMAMELTRERTPKRRLLLRLLVTTLLLFVIGWFIWLSLAFIPIFVSIWLTITEILARPKTPKKGFVIIGCIVLLVGLVLELIGTYQ